MLLVFVRYVVKLNAKFVAGYLLLQTSVIPLSLLVGDVQKRFYMISNELDLSNESIIQQQYYRNLQLRAYRQWVDSDPKECNCETHYDPEKKVCEREKAWKIWVKVRKDISLTKEELFYLGLQ